ncbi:MAG TPA: outer membrane protein [Bradyrhizobium sp.]|jgi:outer membrane immunogenic protein|nr:outer membrane protein [Bradyrhizobium sp.]
MKNQFLTGVAALALLDSSAATAADLPLSMPVKALPVSAPFTWTGFYIGGHVGYSWGRLDGDTLTDITIAPGLGFGSPPGTRIFSFDRNLDPNGVLGGGQLGYNYQIGSAVVGFETDFSWTGQKADFRFNGRNTSLNSEDYTYQETLRAQLEYMGTVRGRLGYAFGMFMPYITGGFAWGHMSSDLSSSLKQAFGPTQTIAASQSRTLTGGTIGAGVEYAVAPKWSLKAEYLYVDLGKETFFGGQSGSTFGIRDHTVRLGVNFRP